MKAKETKAGGQGGLVVSPTSQQSQDMDAKIGAKTIKYTRQGLSGTGQPENGTTAEIETISHIHD
jgi:hypothetical protein